MAFMISQSHSKRKEGEKEERKEMDPKLPPNEIDWAMDALPGSEQAIRSLGSDLLNGFFIEWNIPFLIGYLWLPGGDSIDPGRFRCQSELGGLWYSGWDTWSDISYRKQPDSTFFANKMATELNFWLFRWLGFILIKNTKEIVSLLNATNGPFSQKSGETLRSPNHEGNT